MLSSSAAAQNLGVLGVPSAYAGLGAEETAAYDYAGRTTFEADYISFTSIEANPDALAGYDALWWHYHETAAIPAAALEPDVLVRVGDFVNGGGGLILSGFAPQYVVPLGIEDTPPSTVVRDPKPSENWGFTQKETSHPIFKGLPNPFPVVSEGLSLDNNVCWWNDAGTFDGQWLADTEWVGNLVTIGEYTPGLGRVLIIGTGAYEWDHPGTNSFRGNLEMLTMNAINRALTAGDPTPTPSPSPTPTPSPTPSPTPAPGEDIVIADFEQHTWQGWSATGAAWGSAPTQGGPASNIQGSSYAGSSNGGDGAKGTLTSYTFTIERSYIKFLISGGSYLEQSGYGGQTRINLIVDGEIVRRAAGSSQTDRMDWLQWDVSDLIGKQAHIALTDTATGSWGHLYVDYIVQSNSPLPNLASASRRYLNVPIKLNAPERVVDVLIDGLAVEEFRVNLGTPAVNDFYSFIDLTRYTGKDLLVRVNAENVTDLSRFPLSNEPIADTPIYEESLRPRYHYTARRGFLNDPNGMIYYDGEYHLCYQHNPYQLNVGNQVWGHAVSRDLVHWTELRTAITGDALGQAWSGSSVVDWNNTAGFGEEAIVSFYTSAAGYGNNNIMSAGQNFTQSLAYSTDNNRTLIKYESNPILVNQPPGDNRDPFVFWYEPDQKWVMMLWLRNGPSTFAFYSSQNLIDWTETSQFVFHGVIEVPMLFQLPLDNNANNMKWILWGGDGHYFVGDFNGESFTPQWGPYWMPGGTDSNLMMAASQIFSNAPDGRKILVANDNSARDFPGMPFNKIITFPVELTLRTEPGGNPWIYANPVDEISNLYLDTTTWDDVSLQGGSNPLSGISGEAYEIDATIRWGNASAITFQLGGTTVIYDTAARMLRCTPAGSHTVSRPLDDVATQGDLLKLRILVDIGSVEIFGNQGHRYMTVGVPPVAGDQPLSLRATGTGAIVENMNLHNLGSAWDHPETEGGMWVIR